MLHRWFFLLVTVTTCFAIPKTSTKQELQRLARLPKLEFSIPLQFDRGFGFVPFPDAISAGSEAARVLKGARELPEEAPLYLEAARILDQQGETSGALRHYAKAIDLFRRRLEIAPRDAKALAGLGEALTTLGRFGEAQSTLDRTGELGEPTLGVLLARVRYFRERAWFSAAGEGRRHSASPFLDQVVGMVANSPTPSRIEEAKRYLRQAESFLDQAFAVEAEKADEKIERFLERSAFRAFRAALEVAFTQIQNGDLQSRALRASIYDSGALADLREAAALSDHPEIIAASALAEALAAEAALGAHSSADAFVRQMANRLQSIAGTGGESAAAAGEFLGCLQFHLLKDSNGAQRSLRLALESEPRRYRAWELLTLASAYRSAEEFVATAQARVSALPNPRSSVLLVKSYDMQGDLLRAEWTALEAAATYPNDLLVNLSLAVMLLKDENAESFLWRVDDALKKAEKALGPNPSRQNRLDFVLVKSIYLGIIGRVDEARQLLQSVRAAAETQEVLRVLDS